MKFVLRLRRLIEVAHNLVLLLRRYIEVAHDVRVNANKSDCSGS